MIVHVERMYAENMSLPRFVEFEQRFPDRSVADIPSLIREQLSQSDFPQRVPSGARLAIGVGSRGISNIATIVKAVVDLLEGTGLQPFHFSGHGKSWRGHGGRAGGCAGALRHPRSHHGCPVVSALDVVSLGKTPDGIEAFMDKNAFESDGVMLIGRVKWHTDFAGKIESGLFKMMAIGLGKFAGAQRYHTYAYKLGLEK